MAVGEDCWGDSLTASPKEYVRAHRGTIWRVLLAAGALLAWLTAAPASATSTTAATPSSGNLLQGDSATFSKSIGTWSNYSHANLQWSPSAGDGGSGGLVVTATGPNMAVLSGTSANGGLTTATPGSIYSGAVSADALVTPQEIEPVLTFYTGSGTAITTVFGPGTRVATNSWTQSAPVVAIAPANAASVQMGVIVYNPLAGSIVVFDNAWIEQVNETSSPSVVGPLSTSGNRIVQGNGLPLVPRGVVLNGLETSPTASTVTEQAVIQAKAWGANIVRVPLGEQFWLPSNCDYSPGYQAEVNQVVNWITSLGMVALLDLHTNTVGGCEPGSPHNMADEAQSPTFWSEVASQYSSNPLVAFDLYNEPHDVSNQVWLDGGTTIDTYAPFAVYQTAGMQQLYNSVRATGAQNLVFVSGLNWANDPPEQLVAGQNIVYAIHAYTCPDAAPPACTSPTPYDPATIFKPWVSFSSNEPVAVTEFGWPSQGDGTYAANLIAEVGTHGWGWVAFAWEDAPYPAAWDITERWSPNLPAEPAPSGIPVLCELVRASTGVTPCVAPQITASPTATSQAASPQPPTIPSIPQGAPTARASVLQQEVAPASATSVGALGASARGFGTRSVPGARDRCASACGSLTPAGAVYSHRSNASKPGHRGLDAISPAIQLVLIIATLGIFLVPPLARRLGRVARLRQSA